ncbi:tRNA dihydrouridine synthase DusB [Candidatus Woesearchaeota archaeon]|nr:tRNA dihydrouridine synthase DusB [Candidatus Woesearchaeota archaeon]
MKIGKIKLKNPFILAPLDGVNCAAFRLLCKEQGASLVYSQMLHADGVVAAKESFIERYIDVVEKERPIALQLVGSKASSMEKATEILNEHADIIDINLGCSMPNMLALKAGAYFIKHPEQIQRIVKPVIENTNKPVTAKIRIGWNSQSLNHVKVSKLLEDLGIAAIAVHGRTKQQAFTGKANWISIKQVKENVNIPVIGNGDIFKPEDARSMLEKTGCDAVMIGRAAIGNPFIFKQCVEYFSKGKYNLTKSKEVYEVFIKFLSYYNRYQKRNRFPEIRQHAMWFSKYIGKAKSMRVKLMNAKTEQEVKKIFKELNHA